MWSLVYIGVHTIISKLTLWKKICEEQENCFNVTWGLFSFLAFMNDVCLPPFVLCCVCHFTSFSSGFIFDWQFTEYLYIENLWDYSSVNVLFLRPKSGEKNPIIPDLRNFQNTLAMKFCKMSFNSDIFVLICLFSKQEIKIKLIHIFLRSCKKK